jgi:hypothetical protein
MPHEDHLPQIRRLANWPKSSNSQPAGLTSSRWAQRVDMSRMTMSPEEPVGHRHPAAIGSKERLVVDFGAGQNSAWRWRFGGTCTTRQHGA